MRLKDLFTKKEKEDLERIKSMFSEAKLPDWVIAVKKDLRGKRPKFEEVLGKGQLTFKNMSDVAVADILVRNGWKQSDLDVKHGGHSADRILTKGPYKISLSGFLSKSSIRLAK